MRVTCQQCGAAYGVDDKQIPPQGVRAQCPRCKTLQVVRPESAPQPEASMRPVAPPSVAAPVAPAPVAPRGPILGGAAAAAPFPALPRLDLPAGPVVSCRTCRIALPDPLDAALGVCEDCRAREQDSARPPDITPYLGTETVSRGAFQPVARITGIGPPAALATTGQPSPAAPSFGGAAPEAPAAPARSSAPMAASTAMRAGPEGRGRGPLIAGSMVALALLGAGGGWLAAGRPTFGLSGNGPLSLTGKKTRPVPPALDRLLPAWELALMERSGTSDSHFAEGHRLYAEDTPLSYRQAVEEFRAAVVLDPENLEALAFYVDALALSRGEGSSEAELREMRELLSVVDAGRPRSSLPRRARANVLLAMGDVEGARTEAERAFALATPAEKAEALLAWGRTYLRNSAPIARDKFEEALKLDPGLKRAWFYLGLAAENAGRRAQAMADFEQRLRLDPDQRETLRAVARVHASLGDFRKAREALALFASKYPDVGEPRILLVQIAYAVERDLREADQRLRKLNLDYDRFDDQDKLQLLTVWTAVAREKGELKLAAEQARGALRIEPRHAPAHFQLMLIALSSGNADEARTHLEACRAQLDAARANEYRGRVEALAGNLDAAVAAFDSSIEQAPARIGPRLWAASVLLRKGDEGGAFRRLRALLALEPSALASVQRPVSDYFEAPLEGLAGVLPPFETGDADGLRQTWAAVVQYHLGRTELAVRQLDASLSSDATSLPALIYRAQIELDRKQLAKALSFASRAVGADRRSATALYLRGRALEGLKNRDEAWKAYSQALVSEPNHVGANLRLARMAMEENRTDEAKERLLKVSSAEPEQMEARVALFKLGY